MWMAFMENSVLAEYWHAEWNRELGRYVMYWVRPRLADTPLWFWQQVRPF